MYEDFFSSLSHPQWYLVVGNGVKAVTAWSLQVTSGHNIIPFCCFGIGKFLLFALSSVSLFYLNNKLEKPWYLAQYDPENSNEQKLERDPLHFSIPMNGSTQHQQPLITGVLMIMIFLDVV